MLPTEQLLVLYLALVLHSGLLLQPQGVLSLLLPHLYVPEEVFSLKEGASTSLQVTLEKCHQACFQAWKNCTLGKSVCGLSALLHPCTSTWLPILTLIALGQRVLSQPDLFQLPVLSGSSSSAGQ